MPRRNLFILMTALVAAFVCYQQLDRSRNAPLVNTFSRVMYEVRDKYVQPVDERKLLEGALQGMLGQLDAHSRYIPPSEYTHLRESLDQKFGGIGIQVSVDRDDDRLVVMSPLVGTPAFDAGLRAGDKIMAIDGRSTHGMKLTEAVDLMRGEPGTPVTLTIRREGIPEDKDYVIHRAVINVPTVLGDRYNPDGSWDFRLEADPRFGYVRITAFSEHTAEELRTALEGLLKQGIKGVILDLRNNPGGLLRGAVEICDLFLDKGVIVSTRSRDAYGNETYQAQSAGTLPYFPLAVLVNENSASASEIVAACLQDHNRAVVIGERTYGKGSVQNIIPLEGGTSALKLTVASYWRPSGRNIDKALAAEGKDEPDEDADWGVLPNPGYHVPLTDRDLELALRYRHLRDVYYRPGEKQLNPLASDDETAPHVDPRDPLLDLDPEKLYLDPQLEKAVEYLREVTAGKSTVKAA